MIAENGKGNPNWFEKNRRVVVAIIILGNLILNMYEKNIWVNVRYNIYREKELDTS